MDSDHLLRHYYQEELRRLREDGAAFARRNPRVATRLGLHAGDTPDPFVDRLIESVAWMAADLRRDFEMRLPELSRQMLGILYPNLASPLPSMSIVSFRPDAKVLKDKATGFSLPAGSTLNCVGSHGDTVIRWRTAWETCLHGISVRQAKYEAHHSLPRLVLTLDGVQGTRLPELRFFLRGDRLHTFALHDWLLESCHGLSLETGEQGHEHRLDLDAGALCPAGLSPDDLILPRGQYALPGYQLVQEYFAFPERFLFWRLALPLEARELFAGQESVRLCVTMNSPLPEHLKIDASLFDLCAVPVVNLFTRLAEPITVDLRRSGHRLVCDHRREKSTEAYAILSVTALEEEGKSTEITPYFSLSASKDTIHALYWHMRRAPAQGKGGTDVYLHFKDTRQPLYAAKPFTAMVRLLCTNRNMAVDIRQPARMSSDDGIPATEMALALPPTPERQPAMFSGELWKLVSHLTLHKISLTGEHGANALRETLRLYAPPKDAYSQRQIAGIRSLSATRAVQPLRQHMGGVVRGTRLDLELEEEAFHGVSPLIFGEVMNIFFGLYTELNGFSKLRLHSSSRQGLWREWPARSGEVEIQAGRS